MLAFFNYILEKLKTSRKCNGFFNFYFGELKKDFYGAFKKIKKDFLCAYFLLFYNFKTFKNLFFETNIF